MLQTGPSIPQSTVVTLSSLIRVCFVALPRAFFIEGKTATRNASITAAWVVLNTFGYVVVLLKEEKKSALANSHKLPKHCGF